MAAGVLVADDLNVEGTDLIRAAARLGQGLGLPVTVLHVIGEDEAERFQQEQPEGSGFLDLLMDRRRGELAARVAAAVGDDEASRTTVQVRHGEADEIVIATLDDGGYEYGVIGVRSRSRVGKLMFGSRAQSILLNAPCPILSVPIDG